MGVRVKNVGKIGWRGSDYDNTLLSAQPGEVVEMSAERAKQLLADYPGRFKRVGEPVTVQSEPVVVPSEPVEPSEGAGDIRMELVMPDDSGVRRGRRGKRG